MEFSQRGVHQNQSPSPAAGVSSGASSGNGHNKKNDAPKWLKWVSFVLLLSVTIVLAGLVFSLALSKEKRGEARFIADDRYQAVFLSGGQVYFGRITSLNSAYVRINDIYYLRVNQTVQPDQDAGSQANNDVSLVKLGCELHGPQDEMLVNRDQVIFWENLKEDGQVAKAVAEYQKQNPDGQKCETPAPANTDTTPAN